MPIVEIEGTGQEVEFPDSMSQDEIKSALSKKFGSPKKIQQQPMVEQTRLEKIASSPAINFTLGMGDKLSNLMRSGANLVGANIPYIKTGQGTAYDIGNIAGDIAGFLGGGEIAGAARLGAESIPYIGKAAQMLGGQNFLPKLSRRALGSAGYGALEDPENRLSSAATLGGISAALDASLGGLGKLRPSKLFRGTLSPEELQKNLEAARGTKTDLGSVIQSPFLSKRYSNELLEIPGSGVEKVMMETAKGIHDKGNQLINNLLQGQDPAEITNRLAESLSKNYQKEKVIKNNLYEGANKLAEKSELEMKLPSFSNTVKKHLDTLQDTNILKFEPDIKKMINKLSNYKNPVKEQKIVSSILDVEGKPMYEETKYISPSLKESNLLKGRLSDLAKNYKSSPSPEDRQIGGIFQNLSDSLKSDIKESLKSHGNSDLINEYEKAEKNYASKFSPFLDNLVYKFSTGQKDPDLLISSFIKRGANDRSNLAQTLLNKIPKQEKSLVTYKYLSPAIENEKLNPNKFLTLYRDLEKKPNLKKQLFHDENMRKDFDQFARLVKMNPKALNLMYNPETGAKNLFTNVASALTGLGGGGMHGALAGLILPSLAARGSSKYLTSPSVREKIVKKMINPSSQSREQYAKSLAQALVDKMKNNGNGS